jgi:hypothetical protein
MIDVLFYDISKMEYTNIAISFALEVDSEWF